jgi:hypothetical protein
VECTDCHNPHLAGDGSLVYTNTANSARNVISNSVTSLRGVSGVGVDYTGLANYQVVATNRYSQISAKVGATYEYQICFKCHTGYSFPSFSDGTATFTTNSTSVTGSGTAWTSAMVGMSIADSDDTRTYVITAVAGPTSLTISPAYASATGAGQTYRVQKITAGLTPYYTNGFVSFTVGSTMVTGSNTAWTSGMIGSWIFPTNNPYAAYRISAVNSATSLTITPAFGQ